MQIPESLVTRILQKKCILFLGAGATIESGGLTGKDLGKYIFNNLGDIDIPYKENLARYTQVLVNNGYRDEIEKLVRQRLKNLQPSPKFEKIAQIPWKSIYTTNYDDLIEKSYAKEPYYECRVEDLYNIDGAIEDTKIPLYKLNGDINIHYTPDNPLIITSNDLKNNALIKSYVIKQLMKDLNDTFIFIGYSFEDDSEIITRILDDFSGTSRWESIKEKYVILPNINDDLKIDLESYKINYIQGTADDFFEYLSNKNLRSYQNKLIAIKGSFSTNSYLSSLDTRTLSILSSCFEVYNNSDEYSVDGKFFYRGGNPSWGIIKENFDISRNLKIINKFYNTSQISDTHSLHSYISNLSLDKGIHKVILFGAAVSGKSTTLYRLSHDLTVNGTFSMIFKQQSQYRQGILTSIYNCNKDSFVVIVDNLLVDFSELFKMIDEAEKNNLPITFVTAIRPSDWNNHFGSFNKARLEPYDLELEMFDTITINEAEHFVEKLKECNLVSYNNNYEKSGLIKKIQKSNNNLVMILLELIDRSNFHQSISNEYDNLGDETKLAYAIVSLVYKYGLKLKWEILERTLEDSFKFSWNDFIDKVLKADARGNLHQEEIQGNYYLSGRNSYISEIIVSLYFKGNYSKEIEKLKTLAEVSSGNFHEERFVGTLVNIIMNEKSNYSKELKLELLDYTIDSFHFSENKSFINHLKGEFYLSLKQYRDAIACFDTNVQNDSNKMYSLHSLGKTYFYWAQTLEDKNSGTFRYYIDVAIQKLFEGVTLYTNNEVYYATLLSIFDYLSNNNLCSESDKQYSEKLDRLGSQNLGQMQYLKLKQEYIYQEPNYV